MNPKNPKYLSLRQSFDELFSYRILWFFQTLLRSWRYGSIAFPSYIGPHLYLLNPSRVFIGKNVRLFPNSRLECYLTTSSIVIGSNTSAGPNLTITCQSSVTIKDNVTISSNVFITDLGTSLQANTLGEAYCKPVTIGRNCFIGVNCVLLPGTNLPDNSILGANSVVHGSTVRGILIEN